MKAYSFGEILYDVYPERKCIGGAPLNFAAHFALQGNETYMVSAVGDDENGRDALKWMQEKNIRTDYVKISDKATGTCLVSLDNAGVPSYDLQSDVAWDEIDGVKIIKDEASDAKPTSDTASILDADAVLYFGTLALRSEHNFTSLHGLLKENSFREVFVDINLRAPFYTTETIRFALKNATILKVSGEELSDVTQAVGITNSFYYEKTLFQLAEMFPSLKLIIITLGPNGSLALDCTTDLIYQCPATPADVVSTVGAGDSFSAGFLSEYLKGENIDACLSHASDLSAYVVSKLDAFP